MPRLGANGKPSIFLLDEPAREKENAKRYTQNEVALAEYSTVVDAIFPVVQSHSLQPNTLKDLERVSPGGSKPATCGHFKTSHSEAGES